MAEQAVADYTKLAEGIYLEGLSVDHEREVVWYSDVITGGCHAVTFDGARVGSINEGRMWTGGIMMNADGSVLSTGEGGIMWNNPDSGASGWLLETSSFSDINGINEMWPDGTGGIYFGTNDIEYIIEAKDTRPAKLYRLTVDREVIEFDTQVYFPNGIACDPSRSAFYCSDTFRKGWAFDVAPDLSLTNQRLLLDAEDCDGLALDVEGNVWIAGFRSPNVLHRVKPDGTVLPDVATPAGATTQMRFGGKDGRDLFLVICPEGAGDCLKEGRPLADNAYLWRGRSQVPGVLCQPARFKL
ncbi:MAG: SMP-30/gluconolactonase/LRE family protein [Novosphingobium sp.]